MNNKTNSSAKLVKSERQPSNALIDNLLETGIFKSAVQESLSSEVEKLLEDF
jgi:hypothetical protein